MQGPEGTASYIPIEAPPTHPPLNFRPTTLKTWFLVTVVVFLVLVNMSIASLIAASHYRPDLLHIRRSLNRSLGEYVPGILGSITTILFRTVVLSYDRIMPCIAMASVPITPSIASKPASRAKYPSASGVRLGYTFFESDGRLLTTFLNLGRIYLPLGLVPLKSTFLQIAQDETNSGWTLAVSNRVGYCLIVIYLYLVVCTVSVIWSLWSDHTGLKWEPSSWAARLALVNGSNIFPAFEGLEYFRNSDFRYRTARSLVEEWDSQFGILRLGYWQACDDASVIVHGIRFMKRNKGLFRPIWCQFSS